MMHVSVPVIHTAGLHSFVNFDTVCGMIEFVTQARPEFYQFPALESHIQLLCESPLLTLHS